MKFFIIMILISFNCFAKQAPTVVFKSVCVNFSWGETPQTAINRLLAKEENVVSVSALSINKGYETDPQGKTNYDRISNFACFMVGQKITKTKVASK